MNQKAWTCSIVERASGVGSFGVKTGSN